MKISIDFETYSEADLRKTGAWRYAQDSSTEILCLAYQVNEEPIELWTPGDPIPSIFRGNLGQIWAWNCFFEIAIWEEVGVKRLGWPEIPLECWRDTMAVSAYFGYPLDLDRASSVVGSELKDKRGKQLITMLCKPCKPTKAFPFTRRTVDTHPELFEELYEYCKQDVRAEVSVLQNLPRQELPEFEQEIWYENMRANRRGVPVDHRFINNLLNIRDDVVPSLMETARNITGGISPTQVELTRQWICDHGVPAYDLTADTVRELLETELPSDVRDVLKIRQAVSKSSVKKLDAFKSCICEDGTVKGATVYYGAGTGRFAGRLFQLHNLPRGNFKFHDEYADLILDGANAEELELLFDEPMEMLSTFIRPCIWAPDGSLYDADYSQIEARATAWFCDQNDLLDDFRAEKKIYEQMGSEIFGIPITAVTFFERFVGKQAILGLGYQMGVEKFYNTCLGYGQDIGWDLAEKTVGYYRDKYTAIKGTWYRLNDIFTMAVENPGKTYTVSKIRVGSNGRYLFVKLPSGRTITYPFPRLAMVEKPWGEVQQIQYMGIDSKTNRWVRIDLYGGKILENIIQAICRDVMWHGVSKVIENDFQFLLTVHDQILSQSESGRLDEYMNLMTSVPDWADGLPIAAEGKECLRFSK